MRTQDFRKHLPVFLVGTLIGTFLSFSVQSRYSSFHDPQIYPADILKNCSCSEHIPSETEASLPDTADDSQSDPPDPDPSLFPASPSISSFSGRYLNCTDTYPEQFIKQHGEYFVSYNHIPANQLFKCDETIAYTTHAEFKFLYNLIPLLPRWRGPISIALYTPGSDYDTALMLVQYLRECSPVSSLMQELVTFHIYFPRHHIPESFSSISWNDFQDSSLKCDDLEFESFFTSDVISYRHQENLTYPINVGRNIAKDGATTHFVLPSDIELYPSENMILHFLEMLKQQPELIPWGEKLRTVFVLPVFEISDKISADDIPPNKKVLRKVFQAGLANYFHFKVCKPCHAFPGYENWMRSKSLVGKNRLSVYKTVKRNQPNWEPFYIGLRSLPFWDERLTWRQRNKIAQASILCLLDYTFIILDDAFLVHRPGFKGAIKQGSVEMEYKDTLKFFKSTLEPEMYRLFGENTKCFTSNPKKSATKATLSN